MVALTYPGVYVQEVPSGVRSITGVATSITAFVGRARRGPVDKPVRIANFGDYERQFGGLWAESTMSYAVRHFFLNGGTDAVILRVVKPGGTRARTTLNTGFVVEARDPGAAGNNIQLTVTHDPSDSALFDLIVVDSSGQQDNESYTGLTVATAQEVIERSNLIRILAVGTNPPDEVTSVSLTGGNGGSGKASVGLPAGSPVLELEAANPGEWGKQLRIWVDYATKEPNTLFNLTIQEVEVDDENEVVRAEVFRNLSMDPQDSRFAQAVVNQGSALVRITGVTGSVRPPETDPEVGPAAATGGDDGEPITNAEVLNSPDGGIYALKTVDIFNILCIPPYMRPSAGADIDADMAEVYSEAIGFFNSEKRRAILLQDPPQAWKSVSDVENGLNSLIRHKNAALFFPNIIAPNPELDSRLEEFAPSGAVAGILARTDATRGVWKAAAGIDATIRGATGLALPLTDAQNGRLNPLGVNCLRSFPVIGRIVWGARTRDGADLLASEWKYLPVRRLALYLEESLFRGTQWVVFEPNDEALWGQIRLNIGAFMQNLFRQGAFQGTSPAEAYFVKCDKETTTQNDIDLGIVNIMIGFAPLKPAEFVVLKFQQIAGQVAA